MKKILFIAFIASVAFGNMLNGQEKSPIPGIGRQLEDYYNAYPREKVYVMTDKTQYRPGETLWFRAFVTDALNRPAAGTSQELLVKLFDQNGRAISQDIFRASNGVFTGDLVIPADLPADNYILVAYTPMLHTANRVACLPVRIDPQYSNQWIAQTSLMESISEAGKKNMLSVTLHEISGDVVKNTNLRFQFVNGTEVLAKGKLKTDDNGRAEIPFTIPGKSNGEPFVCEISDTRGNWQQNIWVPTRLDPLVINFYPEGETRVAGMPSKIAFTAFNKWGIPVDVEGQLTDESGNVIAPAKTFTKGLGLIALQNTNKKNLKLVISDNSQSFNMPPASETSVSLTVIRTDTAFIAANLVFPDQQKHPVSLIISRAGSIFWAGDVDVNGSSRIKIPAENLPQGINQLSVFDENGKLLANRILFTDKNERLLIHIKPEKQKLDPGQKMKVSVALTNESGQPTAGSVAVSVSDKFRNTMVCPDIVENLLVSSELETPFSLISAAFQEKISNTALFDVFLLANKIKGFSWAEVLRFKPGSTPDLRSLNNQITGIVTDKNGNRVNKAKVTLVNNRNIQIYSTTTNENGAFSFVDPSTPEDYSIKATDQEGKHDLKVSYGKNFDEQLSAFVEHIAKTKQFSWNEQALEESYVKNNPFLFVRAPKANSASSQKLNNQRQMLESATGIMDVIKQMKPYKIVNNMIVFAGTENSINAQGGALIVVDGQKMGTDISAIANISPLEVDHINVSTNAMDIQRYTGLNSVGVIEIFLKRGKGPDSEKTNTPTASYKGGVRVPNVFEPGEKENTTLLWIPNQQVDSSGLFELTIPAGKVLSDFIIDIQGLTSDGRAGSGKAEFSVVK